MRTMFAMLYVAMVMVMSPFLCSQETKPESTVGADDSARAVETEINDWTIETAAALQKPGFSRQLRALLEVMSVRPAGYTTNAGESRMVFDTVHERSPLRKVLDSLGPPVGTWASNRDAIATLGKRISARLSQLKAEYAGAPHDVRDAIEADRRIFDSLGEVLQTYDAINSLRVSHGLTPLSWRWRRAREAEMLLRKRLAGDGDGAASRAAAATSGQETRQTTVRFVRWTQMALAVSEGMASVDLRAAILDEAGRWVGVGTVPAQGDPQVIIVERTPASAESRQTLRTSPSANAKRVPVAGAGTDSKGYPILVLGGDAEEPGFDAPTATVSDGKSKIPVRLEGLPVFDSDGVARRKLLVLTPHSHLPGGVRIHVVVEWTSNKNRRSLSWSFQTADPSIDAPTERLVANADHPPFLANYLKFFAAQAQVTINELAAAKCDGEARALAHLAATHDVAPAEAFVQLIASSRGSKWESSGGRATAALKRMGEKVAKQLTALLAEAKDIPDADRRMLSVERDMLEHFDRIVEAYVRLNRRVVDAGAPEVGWVWKEARGARLHSLYMQQTGTIAREDATKPGFTPEGSAAALGSCLSLNDAVGAVAQIWRSANSRLFILGTPWRFVGIADVTASGQTQAATFSFREAIPSDPSAAKLLLVPSSHATEVPLSGDVVADPTGANQRVNCGFPITVTGACGYEPLSGANATLMTAKGSVFCTLWTPTTPDAPDWFKAKNTVMLLPKEPLKPATQYKVNVSWESGNGERTTREFTFTTARSD